MRAVPADLAAHLKGGATTLARAWILRRRDGVVLGFTEHDAALAVAGVACTPQSGFSAAAIESELGLAVGDGEVAGALSSDAVTAEDIEAGRYDGAVVETYLVNWAQPAQAMRLTTHEIGEIRRQGQAFEAELRGVTARLGVTVGRTFQPQCDATLGDARCRIDLADGRYRGVGVVSAAADARRFSATGLAAFEPGWFDGGVLTWSSGASSGLRADVARFARGAAVAELELRLAPHRPAAPGDVFVVTAGCDKSWRACRSKFANGANFRGFPHMLGNDWITDRARADDVNDGRRLA